MLFHLVPEDIFQAPAMQRRPFYIWRHPSSQHENIWRHGMFNEAMLPMLMASRYRNAGEPDCCRRRQTTECGQKQCMKKHECGRKLEESTKPLPLKKEEKKNATFDFRGFAPEQIKVKVTDKAVIIRGECKDSHSSMQITKSLPLPEGADKTGIQCRYVDGHVIIQIPTGEKYHLKEKAERKEKPAEVSSVKRDETSDSVGEHEHCVTCPSDQDDVTDKDREIQTHFEESVKKLTGLFSTIFGLQFDGDEKVEEEVKKSVDKEDTVIGEDGASGPEKTTDIPTWDGNAVSKDVTQCDNRDTEETCQMLKYDEKLPLKDGDEEIEKQDADDSLLSEQMIDTELEGDEGEPVTTEARADDTEMPLQERTHSLPNNTSEEMKGTKQKEDFKVHLDLSNYKPENIRVVFRDGDIFVEAEREIKAENHIEVEKLSRRIRLPEKVDESKLKSVLDDGGVLSIQAPYSSDEEQEWRIISVEHENC